MIFGTEGQSAAGTSEKLTPRITISVTASHFDGNAGSRNAKHRWQAIMITEPIINIDAPLPLRSRKKPRNGVRHMARMGKQLNRREAVAASTPRTAVTASREPCSPLYCPRETAT